MDRDRRLSYLILKDVEENQSWSNLAVGSFIAKEGADSPAFVRELCYGVIRNKYLLDYNIGLFLKRPGIKTAEKIWLRMGFYQLSFMDGVKPYAAINETVELARSFKKGSEGFINAVLRNFQRGGCKLKYPENEGVVKYLSVRYSAHENIVKTWIDSYGQEKTEQLLAASNTPAPLALRVNTGMQSVDDLIKILQAKGIDANKSKLADTCIFAKGSGVLDLDEYKKGCFSVQGEASQYAISILAPKPGDTVLDLCAAPGGKTCAMAERMQNKGRIIASDCYEHRVKLIEKEAGRLGISIIDTKTADASVFDPELENSADVVLCDVPCSGLGTLRENPEIKFRPTAQIKTQRLILDNALKYAKHGGKVMYSTCTINPAENEMITKGLNIVFEKQFFTSDNGPDGFYICLIVKE